MSNEYDCATCRHKENHQSEYPCDVCELSDDGISWTHWKKEIKSRVVEEQTFNVLADRLSRDELSDRSFEETESHTDKI